MNVQVRARCPQRHPLSDGKAEGEAKDIKGRWIQ